MRPKVSRRGREDRGGKLRAFSAPEDLLDPREAFPERPARLNLEPCRGSVPRVQTREEALLLTRGISGGSGGPGLAAGGGLPGPLSHGDRRQTVERGPSVSLRGSAFPGAARGGADQSGAGLGAAYAARGGGGGRRDRQETWRVSGRSGSSQAAGALGGPGAAEDSAPRAD